MKIPFYRYNHLFNLYSKDLNKIIHRTASAGKFIMQTELSNFEKELSNFTNSKYCVGVSNATDGLQMLLMASGINKGDEILMSTHTMIATASAVHFTGAIPKLIGINDKDFLINISEIENKITKNKRNYSKSIKWKSCSNEQK